MDASKITIRVATPDDAPALLALYAPYVQQSAITFEYEVPSAEEFRQRIAHTLQQFPYFVALQAGVPVGYAYAGHFQARAAYDWAVETSIYVGMEQQHSGIGRRLYAALEHALQLQGILNLNACIAYPAQEDPYLNTNSVEFHKHLGYQMVGQFHFCGYKFDRWYHMVWMEKQLGSHVCPPPKRRSFPQILDLL